MLLLEADLFFLLCIVEPEGCVCVCADEDGQRWRLKSRGGGDGVEGGIQFSLNGHCVYPSNRLVWKWDGKLS